MLYVAVSLCHRVVVRLCSCLDILPPPSHQQTTPRLPTTPIHPTHHKYQHTLKNKGCNDDKMTSKTCSKNDANSWNTGAGGARMNLKWLQNRKKGVQITKMAQDGAHEWSGPMMRQPWDTFWGPPWEPKNHQKSTFSQKNVPGSAFSSIFAANVVFLDFSVDF